MGAYRNPKTAIADHSSGLMRMFDKVGGAFKDYAKQYADSQEKMYERMRNNRAENERIAKMAQAKTNALGATIAEANADVAPDLQSAFKTPKTFTYEGEKVTRSAYDHYTILAAKVAKGTATTEDSLWMSSMDNAAEIMKNGLANYTGQLGSYNDTVGVSGEGAYDDGLNDPSLKAGFEGVKAGATIGFDFTDMSNPNAIALTISTGDEEGKLAEMSRIGLDRLSKIQETPGSNLFITTPKIDNSDVNGLYFDEGGNIKSDYRGSTTEQIINKGDTTKVYFKNVTRGANLTQNKEAVNALNAKADGILSNEGQAASLFNNILTKNGKYINNKGETIEAGLLDPSADALTDEQKEIFRDAYRGYYFNGTAKSIVQAGQEQYRQLPKGEDRTDDEYALDIMGEVIEVIKEIDETSFADTGLTDDTFISEEAMVTALSRLGINATTQKDAKQWYKENYPDTFEAEWKQKAPQGSSLWQKNNKGQLTPMVETSNNNTYGALLKVILKNARKNASIQRAYKKAATVIKSQHNALSNENTIK